MTGSVLSHVGKELRVAFFFFFVMAELQREKGDREMYALAPSSPMWVQEP